MIVISFLTITLLLALLALQLIRRALFGTRQISWSRFFLAVALSLFVYLYGAWIYISAYGKYAFALMVAIMIVYSLLRRGKAKRVRLLRSGTWRHLLPAGLLMLLNVLYFTGTAGKAEVAELAFPLKPGSYFVLQGGKGLPANLFHYNSRRAVYAMDIVRLDGLGRRCRKVFSRRLDDYFIFADTVYSPCDATVARAVGTNPDNTPPRRQRGPDNLNGIVLEAADYTVYLGHLKQHGVFVQAGEQVKAGQPLGLAGNSGMSLEPHLHIQAHAKARGDEPWYRRPQLLIRFGGKSYLLFEQIIAR